jgi:hypothetical protein
MLSFPHKRTQNTPYSQSAQSADNILSLQNDSITQHYTASRSVMHSRVELDSVAQEMERNYKVKKGTLDLLHIHLHTTCRMRITHTHIYMCTYIQEVNIMIDNYKVKKRTLDLLPNAEENLQKLQEIGAYMILNARTHTYTNIHTHTHTHTFTHTHTHTQTQVYNTQRIAVRSD